MTLPSISSDCKRILILAGSHVGNSIFCTPAIHFLKRNFPSSTIGALATSRRGIDAFRGNPDLSSLHLTYTVRSARRIARTYDFVLGMERKRSARCLTGTSFPHALIEPDSSLHRADHRLEFVRSLTGCSIAPEDRHYVIGWDQSHAQLIRSHLAAAPGDSAYRVGLHLGCGTTAIHGWKFWFPGRNRDRKLWSLQKYIEFAQQLRRIEPRIQIVITGSITERFLARQFTAKVPGTIDLIGKTSIQSVAALMPNLRVFITQDTGILHVACSTNVALIGLFGPTNPAATGPYPTKQNHVVIKRDTMADIQPLEVVAAAVAIISRHDIG